MDVNIVTNSLAVKLHVYISNQVSYLK